MNLEEARRLTIQKQTGTELDIAPKMSGGWNVAEGKGGSPNTPTPEWDKGWPGKGTKPRPEDRPIPTKLAHHTGDKHFTEPTIDELIQGIISGDVPKGTLGDEETENRMIQEYLLRQQQASNEMLIASHDRRKFKTPPAPGSGAANADNLANDLLIRSVTGGLVKPSTLNNLYGI